MHWVGWMWEVVWGRANRGQTVLFWQMWKDFYLSLFDFMYILFGQKKTPHGDTAKNNTWGIRIVFLKIRFIVGHVCSYVEPLYHSSNVIPVTKCCTVLWILPLYKECSHENITAPWGNSGIDLSGKSWFSTLQVTWPPSIPRYTLHHCSFLSSHPFSHYLF